MVTTYHLEAALLQGAVHRQRSGGPAHPDAEEGFGGQGGQGRWKWDDHVANATEAYNARPHKAVHAAPENVEGQPATEFRVLQDNAQKFQHNKQLTEGRQARLQQAGAFRAPTNARILPASTPVRKGSTEPKAALTRRPTPAPVQQLRNFNAAPAPRLEPADRPRRLE